MSRLWPLLIVALWLVQPQSASADEIFLCDDHNTLYVTSPDRSAKYREPCAAAWFQANGTPVETLLPTSASAGTPPAPRPAASAKAPEPARGGSPRVYRNGRKG